MKILFLTNSPVSNPLSEWLTQRPERNEVILYQDKLTAQKLREIGPDLAVSYSYRFILKPEVLDLLPERFINLHISFLPYNRGADPNAWSFLEDTPKGVTIHLIDPGVDTGKILLQKQVSFDESTETLGHSYAVLQEEIQRLFRENWDAIRTGAIRPVAQAGEGTVHFARELAAVKDQLFGAEGWDVKVRDLRERYARLKDRRGIN